MKSEYNLICFIPQNGFGNIYKMVAILCQPQCGNNDIKPFRQAQLVIWFTIHNVPKGKLAGNSITVWILWLYYTRQAFIGLESRFLFQVYPHLNSGHDNPWRITVGPWCNIYQFYNLFIILNFIAKLCNKCISTIRVNGCQIVHM